MKWIGWAALLVMPVWSGCKGSKTNTPVPVQAADADTYRISRAEFDALTLPKLAKLAAAAPHSNAQGDMDGFVLWNLDPLPLRMGLQNNDVVHEVGGHRLRNLAGALAAWNALQRQSEIPVRLTRKGKQRQLLWLIE